MASTRVGFKLDYGEGNTGWQFKYLTRGGGYYFNVGCSDLVASGEIALMQFSDIETFVAEGARMKSGEIVAADLIVLATGYKPQEVLVRKLFGDAVTARVGPIWGFGEGQELRNMYTRTPQARPLVHRRQPRAVPDQFEISGAADQGDRGRAVAAGRTGNESGRGARNKMIVIPGREANPESRDSGSGRFATIPE